MQAVLHSSEVHKCDWIASATDCLYDASLRTRTTLMCMRAVPVGYSSSLTPLQVHVYRVLPRAMENPLTPSTSIYMILHTQISMEGFLPTESWLKRELCSFGLHLLIHFFSSQSKITTALHLFSSHASSAPALLNNCCIVLAAGNCSITTNVVTTNDIDRHRSHLRLLLAEVHSHFEPHCSSHQ